MSHESLRLVLSDVPRCEYPCIPPLNFCIDNFYTFQIVSSYVGLYEEIHLIFTKNERHFLCSNGHIREIMQGSLLKINCNLNISSYDYIMQMCLCLYKKKKLLRIHINMNDNSKRLLMDLRIDNSRQSAIWTILVYSSAILCRLSYYISVESLYFSLSKHITYFIKSFIYNK